MSFPRYGSYRDSGVEWLGEVPSHWPVAELKRFATLVYGDALPQEVRDIEGDIPVYGSNGVVGFHGAANTDQPVLLIGRKGSCGALNWSAGKAFAIDTVYFVDRRSSRVCLRWLFWALHIVALAGMSQDTGVPGLSRDQVYQRKLPCPPPSEQAAIAAFLDRETAKIDALVEEQRRLIALLAEKRQAVISHAVTKGLDPTVPMKDSGVEWLGEVPAHWKVMPIRLAAKLESGHTPSRSRPDWWENCTIPWFSLADIWQVREAGRKVIFETKELVSEAGLANSSARLLPKGTVMLSRTASVGFCAIMGVDMATTQDFANWVCGESLDNEFLYYVFLAMRSEFERLKYGSTHNTIYMPDISAFRFSLPSISEQIKIVEFLKVETSRMDGLLAEARAAITLLQERRAALISAAVTGKIDVRGLVPAVEEAA